MSFQESPSFRAEQYVKKWTNSSVLYGLMGWQNFMPGNTTSGDTIFNNEKSKENKNGEQQQKGFGDVPVFANRDQGVAAWANEDKNGNYYLSVRLPLGLGTVNLFTQDEFKDAFNSFVKHIKEE